MNYNNNFIINYLNNSYNNFLVNRCKIENWKKHWNMRKI